MNTRKRVWIWVQNEDFRGSLVSLLTRYNYEPRPIGYNELLALPPTREIILMETNDDAALLTRCVYELYDAWSGSTPIIIGFLTGAAANANPSVLFWVINSSSALLALLSTDDDEGSQNLMSLINTYYTRGGDKPR